ncbi:MAG: molybdopterin oxidoreductase family protein [bacterium]
MSKVMKRSVCPYDCPDTCGLLVEVKNGHVVRVKGDPEHPFTRGTLCPKMTRYQDTVHSPLRLKTPLVRNGPKGSGDFRAVSWQEAIDRIASKWNSIIQEFGAEAILPYSYAGTMGLIQRNAGHPFFHRLGASRLDRTICSPAKEAGWAAVMGNTPGPDPWDAAKSDLVILWGINALATNIHFLQVVREAKRRGAQVWLVETYRTRTSSEADRVFLVKPGSDGALALGLMHLLVREGLLDRNFLNSHVVGFEELSSQVLPQFKPNRVKELTGLDESTLEEMARAFGRARCPFIRLGSGLSRYANGAMSVRSIVCLPALVGAYARPGGGCLASTSTGKAFDMSQILREDFMTQETRRINMNQLGTALNQIKDPPVMGLYVYHSNPAAVAPDQNQVIQGLSREDLFTVVHERFMTDTALYADVVLPATSSLEHSDLYRSYGHYCIQKAEAVIPPVGQSKSNLEVFGLLAQAMGFEEPFFRKTDQELIQVLLSIPSPLRQGIDEKSLWEGKPVELRIKRDPARPFDTPSGKIEILNPREPLSLPQYLPPYDGPGEFRLMTAPSLYGLNSSFREQQRLLRLEKGMFLIMNPTDASEKRLSQGQRVVAFNELGEVPFILQVSSKVPRGVVVAEGVWWLAHCPGPRSVNALTSQRLTDRGGGSTFYDNKVDVRAEHGQ